MTYWHQSLTPMKSAVGNGVIKLEEDTRMLDGRARTYDIEINRPTQRVCPRLERCAAHAWITSFIRRSLFSRPNTGNLITPFALKSRNYVAKLWRSLLWRHDIARTAAVVRASRSNAEMFCERWRWVWLEDKPGCAAVVRGWGIGLHIEDDNLSPARSWCSDFYIWNCFKISGGNICPLMQCVMLPYFLQKTSNLDCKLFNCCSIRLSKETTASRVSHSVTCIPIFQIFNGLVLAFSHLGCSWVGHWNDYPVLCCAVLCCAVLCCAALCCAARWCAVLCGFVLLLLFSLLLFGLLSAVVGIVCGGRSFHFSVSNYTSAYIEPSVSRAGCLSLPPTLLLLSGEYSGRILLPRSLLYLGCALGFTRAVCSSAAEAVFRVLVC